MSSPDINYPAQPTYGEGMADAMKAQMEQLLGQGEYEQMYADAGFAGGNLGDVIRGVEAPIRQQTAQTDTDVLRQTLLGTQRKVVKDPETGKYGIPGGQVVNDSDGNPQTAGGGRYQLTTISSGGITLAPGSGFSQAAKYQVTLPTYAILDTTTGGLSEITGESKEFAEGRLGYEQAVAYLDQQEESLFTKATENITSVQSTIDSAGGDADAAAQEFTFTNPYTGEPLKEGEVVREGDGMIDLLGDRRKTIDPTTGEETNRMAGFDEQGNFLGLSALAEDIQAGNLSRQRERDLADVERLADRYSAVMEDFAPATVSGITGARDLIEEQKDALTTANTIIDAPSGSTYGGDISAGTMDAAKVADPLTLKAGTSYNATKVANPMELTADTSFTPSASVSGDGYTATAGLEGGEVGQDAFRQALMEQATAALDNGLSDRELANISNAARARSTMMGRTFDQSGAIEEAQALVAEDNNRRMQNRAFAQQALGQEADIRERDLGRGLQASMQNQAALNRAAEFGASQDMQAQLANQAATNQALSQGLSAGLSQEALAAQQAQAKAMADATSANQAAQFGVGAGMEQDALRAQLGQQTSLAQAQLNQQANAFEADAAQRASQVNQAQKQQAAQFGVGATMDAQRINESLRQQGLGNYINAVGNLSQIEKQTSLDPFQALLGRGGGSSLQAGQGVFGQAGYGLQSGPQYLNPEAGLGYISQMAANDANMAAAEVSAKGSMMSGLFSGLGSLGGGLLGNTNVICWVAREVYGETNSSWMLFREWLIDDSPSWFRNLYIKYGERFAQWISDKPRIKSIIRKWMDSKIGG